MKKIMNYENEKWTEFANELMGMDDCRDGFPNTIKCLEKVDPDSDVEETINFLRKNGGYCDCEVIFNVILPKIKKEEKS